MGIERRGGWGWGDVIGGAVRVAWSGRQWSVDSGPVSMCTDCELIRLSSIPRPMTFQGSPPQGSCLATDSALHSCTNRGKQWRNLKLLALLLNPRYCLYFTNGGMNREPMSLDTGRVSAKMSFAILHTAQLTDLALVTN
jgi:hypothetical protein